MVPAMPQASAFIAAVGDVHGDLAQLDRAIEGARRWADGRALRFVFLGDYVDRGPDSAGVIRRLVERTAEGDVALKGNHEDMLLAALSDADEDVRFWIDNGGEPTLLSYGIDDVIDARRLPEDHLDWMKRRPLSFDDGLRFYCHAGIDPTLPLDGQRDRDLIWWRHIVSPHVDLPRLIVHGHIVVGRRPAVRRNSVSLDTGCGQGGPLSVAVFDRVRRAPVALIVGGEIVAEAPEGIEAC